MNVGNFIKIHSGLMKTLSELGVKIDDFKYVELFADYERMASDGNKITYIVSVLANKYKVSETNVYRVLRRFKVTV